ncbi:MAG: YceI family protein [Deltaproteobacteria bacterium]|nr:YceI family protein [Deltaproteobacteria bacterium]
MKNIALSMSMSLFLFLSQMLTGLILFIPAARGAEAPWPFQTGEHCVAYSAVKEMFVMFDVTVLGRNCMAEGRIENASAPEGGRFVADIPVEGFDSGSGKRDGHVADLLGGPSREPMRFESEPLKPELIKSLLAGQSGEISGMLSIKGKRSPVRFHELRVERDGQALILKARGKTTFNALGLKVPSVGPGGIIAEPGDELELLVQFQMERLTGYGGLAGR